MSLYGEQLYSAGQDNTTFFLKRLVESLPPPYRPAEFRDFLERFLQPSAEDVNNANAILDALNQYVTPESAPEEWVNWILTEWFGWTLIPDGYPLSRKRQLLRNLYLHYERRYTVRGVRELLGEFGVVAEVYDRPIYVGGYYGSFGSRAPLHARVRVLYYEPFYFPRRAYTGGYIGGRGTYAYTTPQVITEQFVMDLIHWSRAAGVSYLVEFVTSSQQFLLTDTINDDDEIIIN
jgi:phage tail-like protein